MFTAKNSRAALLLIVAAAGVLAALAVDPIAQDPGYHLFADSRSQFSIPNFLVVVSNLPFVFVGIAGLAFIWRHGEITVPGAEPAWYVFFAGIFLVAFGSGYYHLEPNNGTLLWDRLPMTLGFMSFVAIVVGEYLSPSAGKKLLLPLLLAGAASVFYWAYTEALGRGDLRAYAVVQFLPMLLIPMIVMMYRKRSDLGPYIAWMVVFYGSAKLLEYFDYEVFAAGQAVSGHALKHVFAAMVPASLLYGLRQRRYHAPRLKNKSSISR